MKRIPRFFLLAFVAGAFVFACPADQAAKKKADKPETKTAAAKPEATKAAEAKPDDAKAPDAKADDKPEAAAADTGETPGAEKFRKGQPAPVGMSPDDVKAYAAAQGDPEAGDFTLEEALAGDDKLADPQAGKLQATFDTTMGKFKCELFEDKAPATVANFVGLARGVRPSYDKDKDAWVKEPFYDDVVVHRVVKGFMIQTGDPSGSGTGGPGYVIVDETDNGLKHTDAGMLSMANRGPNTGSSQFFVTVTKTPHLDGKHTVFGKCDPKVALKISEVKVDPRRNHRPYEEVKINTIEISRK